MEIIRDSVAGTLESSDVMVKISPSDHLSIMVNSSVYVQFGEDIYHTVERVINQLGVSHALVIVEDKGALDFVLEARIKSAILRASDIEKVDWGKFYEI